jgi:hypothetical protein
MLGALCALVMLVTAHGVRAMDAPDHRDPQFVKAMRAAVRRYPELIDHPARGGFYSVTVLARADGSLHSSQLIYLAPPASSPVPVIGPDLDKAFAELPEGPDKAKILKGEQIADLGKASENIDVNWYVLREDFDDSRDVRRVADAVRAQYTNPMRPTRDLPGGRGAATEINLLTVFMTEDGFIARKAMEPIRIDAMEAMNPRPLHTLISASAFTPPPVPVEAFKVLGLEPGQIGQTGLVIVEPERVDPEAAARGADAQRLIQQLRTAPAVLVRYAWPRRPGEPVGGRR